MTTTAPGRILLLVSGLLRFGRAKPKSGPPAAYALPEMVGVIVVLGVLIGLGANVALDVAWADLIVGIGLIVLAIAFGVALKRTAEQKTWRILVAGAIGWLLAALFGGADAIDVSKGWGDPADVMKTIAASFTIAGTAQILRFGLPKKEKPA